MNYYCVTLYSVHVYFSTRLDIVERFRDKHSPGAYIWQTDYPHFHGFAHRIGSVKKR